MTYDSNSKRRTSAWRKANPERAREIRTLERERLRYQVRKALGGCCASCGEADPLVLCIDHIHNDGFKDRRLPLSGKPKTSTWLYRKIRREGFPRDKYQLLCANCNLRKHHKAMLALVS